MSENTKGCNNGWSAGNQKILICILVGSSEATCESQNIGKI